MLKTASIPVSNITYNFNPNNKAMLLVNNTREVPRLIDDLNLGDDYLLSHS